MADRITVLRHSRNLMAKAWCADGSIKPYDDAKYFRPEAVEVRDIGELSTLLQRLENDAHACLVRGAYVGDDLARQRDPEDFRAGFVRRALDYFDDQPLHTVLADIDGFEPLSTDPLEDPVSAIDEFIHAHLPDGFHGVAYHWQLSNSAGRPEAAGKLKAHAWFWLAEPVTSAQAKAWAKASGAPIDLAVLNPVQVHYTAAPVFEEGVTDPVRVRSGFVAGILSDEVMLDGDASALATEPVSGGRLVRMAEVTSEDPIVQRLAERGMLSDQRRDGSYNVTCPFEDEHTGAGGPSSTVYFPPHTGGHALGHFKCLHSHCDGRARGLFLARLDMAGDAADDFTAAPRTENAVPAAVRKGIPEAHHLVTDQANAGRIVNRFGRKLLVAAGRWYSWDGRRWAGDEAEVYRYACTLSKIIHGEADQWAAKPAASDEERKARDAVVESLRSWAKRSEMKATIEAAVQLARRMLAVDDASLDRDPWALNCANGTVDLRTGELKPHDAADFITKLIPLDYDPRAEAPLFEEVLGRVTMEEGRATKPLASFLQRWFGYCATGSTREQVFAVHWGAGSNGKSTILDTIGTVLGDYAATAAPGLMVSAGKDRHPTEIADLAGRRMVTAHESGEGNLLREDFVKQATGGDKLKARWMRADFFEFSPTHKLQLVTNHKPGIKGQDHGIWRRVLLVPYFARFGKPEEVATGRAQYLKDTTLAARLVGESAGILTWVVRGAQAWFADGLRAPDAVLAASADYQREQDRARQFIDECCELGPEFSEPLTVGMNGLYPEYVSWCKEGGFMPLARNRLLSELERIVPFFAQSKGKEINSAGRRREVLRIRGLRMLAGE